MVATYANLCGSCARVCFFFFFVGGNCGCDLKSVGHSGDDEFKYYGRPSCV